MSSVGLLSVLLNFGLIAVSNAAGCSWTSPQGFVFDLNDLRNETADYVVDVEGYPAYINVCGPTVTQQCGAQSAACWFGPAGQISLGSSLVSLFGNIQGNKAGQIYIVGGQDASGQAVSTVTMLDASDWSYTTEPSLPSPRSNAGASVLANGQIFAFGGTSDGTDPLATFDGYSVVDGTWTPMPPMTSSRTNFGAASLGSTLFAVSGYGGDSWQQWTLSQSEFYDPQLGVWQPMSNIPSPRQSLAVVIVGDYLFAAGGLAAPPSDVTGVFERYMISTDTWSSLASLPTARQGLACASVNMTVYCAGGDDGQGNVFDVVEAYDLVEGTWSTVSPLPGNRTQLALVGIGSPPTLYAIGGNNGNVATDTVFVYNISINEWSMAPSLPQAIQGHAAVAVGPDAGVALQYPHGQDDRAIQIEVVCDPTAGTGEPVFVEEAPKGSYNFYWFTEFGCPPAPRYPHTVLATVSLNTTHGLSIAYIPVTQKVWAIVDYGGNISVFDPVTLSVDVKIPLPAAGESLIWNPVNDIAYFGGDDGFVYMFNPQGVLLGKVSGTGGGAMRYAYLSESQNQLYWANEAANLVWIIDCKANRVLRTLKSSMTGTWGVAAAEEYGLVFVTSEYASELEVFNLNGFGKPHVYNLPAPHRGVYYDSDRNVTYMINTLNATVTVFNVTTMKISGAISIVEDGGWFFAYDAKSDFLLMTAADYFVVLQAATGITVTSLPAGGAFGLAYADDLDLAFVATFAGQLYVIVP